jgi:hypothetical protein
MKKTVTITVSRIDEEDLKYFRLDSPGYFIARDAERAGDIAGAASGVEVICLINKLYEMEFLDRVTRELAPFGKAEEFVESNPDERTDLIIQLLGKERAEQILRDVIAVVRKKANVGQNDKVAEH